MRYSPNAVYTYVRKALVTAHQGIYVTSRLEPVARAIPAVRLWEMSRTRPIEYATLDHSDDQWSSTFSAEIYADNIDNAMATAYNILATIEAAFKSLGYIETFCEPVANIDPSLYRVVARFTRQIGGADQIPTN